MYSPNLDEVLKCHLQFMQRERTRQRDLTVHPSSYTIRARTAAEENKNRQMRPQQVRVSFSRPIFYPWERDRRT